MKWLLTPPLRPMGTSPLEGGGKYFAPPSGGSCHEVTEGGILKKIPIILCLFIFTTFCYAKADLYPFQNNTQACRFQSLTQNFRCLVCQNQSIADSDAPLATDLRKVVYEQILAGKSDKEIENYLIQRYGNYVVFTPPLNLHTLALWGLPVVILLFGMIIAINIIRKARRPS